MYTREGSNNPEMVMYFRRLLLSLFGAVLIPTSALAQQEPSDFAICERFSHSGLIDSRDTSIAREQVSRDFKYVCSRRQGVARKERLYWW